MPRTSLRFLLVVSLAAAPIAAPAQTVSAACKPVLDANTKEISTPHHLYTTTTSPAAPGKSQTGEIISTPTASFILYNGTWTRINMTPQANLDQMKENLRDVKVYECQKQPDAIISGVPMFVYLAHSENDMAKSDARFWVAKSTGLIYREDIDMDTGDPSEKRHVSERFDYANVQPPAGVK
ncbi:MAG TPA: hypothetical protein VGO46_00455 [Gemmatimonadaceae bacterium]|nr:hypothetical protein [Gemmatimonadaceae bacterium]